MRVHVLVNPGMKNAELMVFMSLVLLLKVTVHISVIHIYLKLIAVAKGRTKHIIENVKFIYMWLSGSCRSKTP